MIHPMKITVEISDPLLTEARALMRKHHTTLRALVEEGLRSVIAQKKQPRRFQLKQASFQGNGLHPDADSSWESIRKMIYQGRGG